MSGAMPGAGVRDLDADVVGRRHAGELAPARLGLGHVLRADRHGSAVRHGVPGIHGEVDDHLFELVHVGLDEPEVASLAHLELDALSEEALQEERQVGERLAELHGLRAERLAAREGEQLAHQARRPVRVLLDLHQVLERRVRRPVAREQQVRVADDGLEDVVEVVRDAAGELADRLHLLRLDELLLEEPLLGRVERVEDRPLAQGRVAVRHGADPEPGRTPALPRQRDVERAALARCRGGERRFEPRPVGRGDEVERGGAAAARAGARRRRASGRTGSIPGCGIRVERRDGERRGIEEARESAPRPPAALLELRHPASG
jgi:hypothetical protein